MDKDVQEYLINKIKSEYTEKTDIEFETLMKLDRKIKLPPTIFTYSRGIIGALFLGFGMSLTMTNLGSVLGIGSVMVFGIVFGIIGIAICGINYPLYKRFLDSRKKEYSSEVIRLADKLSAK